MSKNLKYSGVNWLGDIPNDWTSIPLKRHTSYVSRGRSPSYTEDENSGIPVLNQACVYWNGLRLQNVKFQDPNLISGHRGKVRQNDLLVNSTGTGTLGRVAIFNLDADYLADSHITIVRPISEKLNAGFLYYLLQTGIYQGYIYTVLSTGATNQIELSREGLSNTPVIVPSINTQIRIAAFLDRKTAAIDTLIAKKQRLIELLEEKRAALINQAVTKGLNPDVPMKDSGIPWIGEIPEHWEILPVKRLARPGRKTFVDGNWIELPFIEEDGIRLIQTGNVGIGKYREKGYRYISERTFRDLKCTEVEPQNVLICRLDGPVGRACLAPDLGVKMITSVDNAILKSDSVHDPRFIVYFMSSKCYLEWNQVLCRVGGGHRLRISRTMLGDLRIPIPPTSEQYDIADQIDQKTSEIEKISNLLLKQIEKLQEYRQSLITAAVTGKLEVAVGEAA